MSALPDLTALIAEVERGTTVGTGGEPDSAGGRHGLDRLTAAEDIADELNALGTRLVGYFVEQLRAEGLSWADIGSHVGISKQAAQQRYGPSRLRVTVSDLVNGGGLVRLTARTRNALMRAEAHAARLGSPTVDPQHLLLGMLDDTDTLAVQALDRLGVDRDDLRRALDPAAQAAATTGPTPATTGPTPAQEPTTPLPLGIMARRSLEVATTQALKLNHNYVGTEHLLLALAQQQPDPVGQILADRGVTLDRAQNAVRAAIDSFLRRH